jgi:hypothetical protein
MLAVQFPKFSREGDGMNTERSKLLGVEVKLAADRRAALEELRTMENARAAQALEALISGQLAMMTPTTSVADLRDAVVQLDAMTVGVRGRRVELLKRQHGDQAAEFRKAAKQLEHASGRLRAQVTDVLAKLSELEGVEYDLSVCLCQRRGTWFAYPGMELIDSNPDEVAPDPTCAGFATPRHIQLIREAEELRRKAEAADAFTVPADGNENAETITELLARLANDESRIWPSIPSIEAWFERVAARARKEWGETGARTQVSLVWRSGEIDREASQLQLLRSEFVPGAHGPGFARMVVWKIARDGQPEN